MVDGNTGDIGPEAPRPAAPGADTGGNKLAQEGNPPPPGTWHPTDEQRAAAIIAAGSSAGGFIYDDPSTLASMSPAQLKALIDRRLAVANNIAQIVPLGDGLIPALIGGARSLYEMYSMFKQPIEHLGTNTEHEGTIKVNTGGAVPERAIQPRIVESREYDSTIGKRVAERWKSADGQATGYTKFDRTTEKPESEDMTKADGSTEHIVFDSVTGNRKYMDYQFGKKGYKGRIEYDSATGEIKSETVSTPEGKQWRNEYDLAIGKGKFKSQLGVERDGTESYTEWNPKTGKITFQSIRQLDGELVEAEYDRTTGNITSKKVIAEDGTKTEFTYDSTTQHIMAERSVSPDGVEIFAVNDPLTGKPRFVEIKDKYGASHYEYDGDTGELMGGNFLGEPDYKR